MLDPTRARVAATLLCCLTCVAVVRAQSPARRDVAAAGIPEVLRGVVKGEDGSPVVAATILVTRAPDRALLQTASGADGSWRIRFVPGSGDYFVFVAASGKVSGRKRVSRGLAGFPTVESADSIFVVDIALKTVTPQTLETVEVRDEKPRPQRTTWSPELPPVGSTEAEVSGLLGTLAPDEVGRLQSTSGTTPGILVVSGGISALGLGPRQNGITLGGLQFGGANLPRDARTFTRVATSPLDPSRGWFGGAQTAVELSPGSQFDWRQGHLTLDAPALQFARATNRGLGLPVTALDASYGQEGSLAHDHLAYSVAVQGGRRAQDAFSLLDSPRQRFVALGISPDSAARVLGLARAFGFPQASTSEQSFWGARTTDRMDFSARIGTPTYDYETGEEPRRLVSATIVGSWRRTEGIFLDPSQASTRAGSGSTRFVAVQLMRSAYITSHDWLLELRSGFSASRDVTRALFAGPGADILVASDSVAEAKGGLTYLGVGGNSALDQRQQTGLWETQGQLSFFADKPSNHKVAMSGDLRFDHAREQQGVDNAGTYRYSSLSDFASERPSSYSRALAVPRTSAGVWNGYLGLVDEWRASAAVSVLYGVRAEANYFPAPIAGNAKVFQDLGVRTNLVPNTAGLSPRLGFRWRRSIRTDGTTMSELGILRRPGTSVIRGGVGDFRTFLGPDLVLAAKPRTGLSSAPSELLCVGAAVPMPNWNAWAQGDTQFPTSCAGGAPTSLTDTATAVTALSPGFTAPRSLRANVSWSGIRFGTAWELTGIYSMNRNQLGVTDANFAGLQRFTATGEGRSIFVPVASIDPNSGFLSPAAARRIGAFGTVLLLQSQLHSVSRQATVAVSPAQLSGKNGWVTGAYSVSSTRQQSTGFDGATFGDPRLRRWSRGDFDVRHQFIMQGGVVLGPTTVILYANIASGLPYTPIVGSDVNGDGFVNDVAVVPVGDTLLGRSLDAVSQSAPSSIRRCLELVRRGPVSRNSCEGPWTAMVNARVAFKGSLLGLGERTRVAINLTNPLAGLDQLLHGSNLRGWGGNAYPDPTLLQTRGFDAAQQRFVYAVNPRFGSTLAGATSRVTPFRITLDVSVDFARSIPQQQVDKWYGPSRLGGRLSAEDLRKRYMRNFADPYRAILADPDTLLLMPAQSERLLAARNELRAQVDSIWRVTAIELAGTDQRYESARFLRKQDETAEAVWELMRRQIRATLPMILSPVQLSMLPGFAGSLLRQEKPKKHLNVFL